MKPYFPPIELSEEQRASIQAAFPMHGNLDGDISPKIILSIVVASVIGIMGLAYQEAKKDSSVPDGIVPPPNTQVEDVQKSDPTSRTNN